MEIQYVLGDATQPRSTGARLIVHGCNDQGMWDAGFTGALSRRWPCRTRNADRGARNKNVCILRSALRVPTLGGLWVANLISQQGIRRAGGAPPIRYAAVREGLAR